MPVSGKGKVIAGKRAGWGTAHPKSGRCKLHGGKASTARLKHGISARSTATPMRKLADVVRPEPSYEEMRPVLWKLLNAYMDGDYSLETQKKIVKEVKQLFHF